jgi:hypothetical protein
MQGCCCCVVFRFVGKRNKNTHEKSPFMCFNAANSSFMHSVRDLVHHKSAVSTVQIADKSSIT